MLDNNTADPIFVVGAEDQPQQPITPVATPAGPTATPTVPGPTATPTPPSGGHAHGRRRAPAASMVFRDQVSGNSTTTITRGHDGPLGVGGLDQHSTTSNTGVWDSGIHGEDFTFDHQFNSAGSFPYHCVVHGTQMSGTVAVNP